MREIAAKADFSSDFSAAAVPDSAIIEAEAVQMWLKGISETMTKEVIWIIAKVHSIWLGHQLESLTGPVVAVDGVAAAVVVNSKRINMDHPEQNKYMGFYGAPGGVALALSDAVSAIGGAATGGVSSTADADFAASYPFTEARERAAIAFVEAYPNG